MTEPPIPSRTEPQTQARAGGRIYLLAATVVCLALVAGAFWAYRRSKDRGEAVVSPTDDVITLSDSTRAVLQNLDSPVEIHFYSLLDKASVPAPTFDFAERINKLLAEYEKVAGGKITLTRYSSSSDANAASADGIKPFNRDKGDPCYLGLSVSCSGRKESFPQLSAEWEQALEFDLSRAIARLAATKSTPAAAAAATLSPTPDSTAIEEVKRAIPNLASVSVEAGTQILRDAAMKDFKAAVDEMDVQVKEAQQRFIQAQQTGSEAEQQAAAKQLQQVQSEQAEKIKQVAARLQAHIAALEQLKK